MTKHCLLISFILGRTKLNESDMINPLFCPDGPLGLINRIRKFFAGFATDADGRSHSATNLPKQKTSDLSSITTPNGPWVYTVVPWED
jgi:hypothetical protein